MERHLYIIGNGFDLHHGINSSYRNFRDWLYENEPTVIQDIEEANGAVVMMSGGLISRINLVH